MLHGDPLQSVEHCFSVRLLCCSRDTRRIYIYFLCEEARAVWQSIRIICPGYNEREWRREAALGSREFACSFCSHSVFNSYSYSSSSLACVADTSSLQLSNNILRPFFTLYFLRDFLFVRAVALSSYHLLFSSPSLLLRLFSLSFVPE